MKTFLAYVLCDGRYFDETVWAESEEQAREEIANWYPLADSIMISEYEKEAQNGN